MYAWVFGDGSTSSQQNPSHTFTNPGNYNWTMTASVQGINCSKTGSITVTAPCTLTCTASASPDSGVAPLQVIFSASATPAHCTGSVSYTWAFGDGESSTQQNPSHTYSAAGTYTWTMTATVQGINCSKTGTITVTAPCTLTCTATVPATGIAGQAVSFSSTAAPSNCAGTPSFGWTFGDGATSTEQNTSHTYAASGSFTWTMTASVQGVTCTKTGTIVVSEPCVVTCVATVPGAARAGDAVPFSATAEAEHCTGSVAFAWNFGDGATSTEQYPAHTYALAGSYPWTLTVTVDGKTCAKTETISVSEACVVTCAANAAPATGVAPLSVVFTGSATAANCNGAPAYSWVFGDGATSSEQSPSHTFSAPGSYAWTLTVTAEGKSCAQTGTVTVIAPCVLACEAAFAPQQGKAPLVVTFTGSATATNCAGEPAYTWAFGDGAVSAEQNPLHTYTSAGSFAWTLTVTAGGATCTRTGTVAVEPGLPGDGNGDGVVSIGEVQQAINMFLELQTPGNGVDCNGDGIVSIGEVQKVINAFLGLASSC
jgi:PKD repeat protein